ncbi:PSP1 family protein [Trypanosoma grayi]|uniref:PSP1 family protein n=1 Tax=Trypanosoma grayi TaxID=71804 RepID=UPI0004F4BE28|nr:PSP1 family protein [Trypanosoma grayi]KEG12924.1 PSP1 family protein [Trypanosoma grayi]
MYIAPLADCTAGAIQEANKANNGVNTDLKKVIRKKHAHNPYCRAILTPVTTLDTVKEKKRHEPNPNAPAFVPSELPWNMYAPYTYDESMYMDEAAYESSVYASAYYYAQRIASVYAGPTSASYQIPMEPTESANTSSVADKAVNLSDSTISCGNTGTSVVSTPIKRSNNLYKMYVDGRPKVVRGVIFAEVNVELRLGNEVFIVNDVPQIFGAVVKAEELVDRYVIVEGDRGEDLGRIVSVARSELTSLKNTEDEKKEKHPLHVLREALPEEVEAFHRLDQLEEEALRFCKAAIHSLNMRTPLQVQRAVFQFDRKKLTFTYCSDSYVEFKSLLRALNRQYQCRIWMHQLNWEVNCRQRRQTSDEDTHRKNGREHRRRGGAKKDSKRSQEVDVDSSLQPEQ